MGEFKEYGFAVELRLSDGLSPEDRDMFWAAFIALIEDRGLAFGGAEEGYVTQFARGSATEEDRSAVRAWLDARPGVARVEVGLLE